MEKYIWIKQCYDIRIKYYDIGNLGKNFQILWELKNNKLHF